VFVSRHHLVRSSPGATHSGVIVRASCRRRRRCRRQCEQGRGAGAPPDSRGSEGLSFDRGWPKASRPRAWATAAVTAWQQQNWHVRLILAERADASKPGRSARRWRCCLQEELEGDDAATTNLTSGGEEREKKESADVEMLITARTQTSVCPVPSRARQRCTSLEGGQTTHDVEKTEKLLLGLL
jgi:hypothetical protein